MEVFHPYLGKFSILKQIGTGSFASVYLAKHFNLQYLVAIKIFKKGFMEEYIRNSFNIAKSIIHPFICQYFDLFDNQKGEKCILMEYVEGMTLLDYANLKSPLKEHEIQIIFGQLVSAIDYLHKHHIIHRDLKCENIMIDNYNNIRLIDFGFSCSDTDMHSTACGSPAYLAPEIINSDSYGISVDIWSLGIILYALKYSQLPFENPNFSKLLHLITTKEPHFPMEIQINPSLLDLIQKLLIKQPEKRITIGEIKQHPFFTTNFNESNYYFDEKLLNLFIHEKGNIVIPEKPILELMRLSENEEYQAINDIKLSSVSYYSLTYTILYKNHLSTKILPKYNKCFTYPRRLSNRTHCKAAKTTGDLPTLISKENHKTSHQMIFKPEINHTNHIFDNINHCSSDSSNSTVIDIDIPKYSPPNRSSQLIGSPLLFSSTLKVRHFSSNTGPYSNDNQFVRYSPGAKKNVLNLKNLTLATQMSPNINFSHQNHAGSLPSNDVLPQIDLFK